MTKQKNQQFIKRFYFACSGINHALKNEKSFRTQLVFASSLGIILLALRPKLIWVAMFSICVALVFAFELLNTALEALCDATIPEPNPIIKTAKDCAAAAVLMMSLFSVFLFFLFWADYFSS